MMDCVQQQQRANNINQNTGRVALQGCQGIVTINTVQLYRLFTCLDAQREQFSIIKRLVMPVHTLSKGLVSLTHSLVNNLNTRKRQANLVVQTTGQTYK